MFRNIQPDTIFIEGVFIREKAFQVPASFLSGCGGIHGGILLMTKDDPLAGTTFTTSFPTLRALGFLFVTCW